MHKRQCSPLSGIASPHPPCHRASCPVDSISRPLTPGHPEAGYTRCRVREFGQMDVEDIQPDDGLVTGIFMVVRSRQRISDAIAKGVNLTHVPLSIRHLKDSKIHVQSMGVRGLSGGIGTRRRANFCISERSQGRVDIRWNGNFVLTPGAMGAREPRRFGIAELRTTDHGIVQSFDWIDSDGEFCSGDRHQPMLRRWMPVLTKRTPCTVEDQAKGHVWKRCSKG